MPMIALPLKILVNIVRQDIPPLLASVKRILGEDKD
jgi:hypothetical protein